MLARLRACFTTDETPSPEANGLQGALLRRNTRSVATFAGRQSRYWSSASPTSCGSGNRTWYRPFPVTCNVPLFQSISLRRRAATSPERNPSRTNISKIARSRSPPGVVPLDAAINRPTSSADKQRGSLASRQCAKAGIALARSSRHSPRKLRNRRKARREVISACVVEVPLWLARSRRKFRTACAFHRPTSSPSVRTKSVAPRA